MDAKSGMDDTGHTTRWNSFGISHRGYVRRVNEDSYLNQPEHGIWVVADGMGGHDAGDVASQKIVESLAQTAVGAPLSQRVDEVEDRLDSVNAELTELANAGQGNGTIGSTVVAFVAEHGVGVFIWAGDSRIYRFRNGALTQLSTDHSQVEYYISQGLITREQAEYHPERHVITRAVGSHRELQLDADLCDLRPGDRYLLCTDGLMRHLTTQDVEGVLSGGDAQQCCIELVDLTLQRGAKDNVTVVLVDVTDPD